VAPLACKMRLTGVDATPLVLRVRPPGHGDGSERAAVGDGHGLAERHRTVELGDTGCVAHDGEDGGGVSVLECDRADIGAAAAVAAPDGRAHRVGVVVDADHLEGGGGGTVVRGEERQVDLLPVRAGAVGVAGVGEERDYGRAVRVRRVRAPVEGVVADAEDGSEDRRGRPVGARPGDDLERLRGVGASGPLHREQRGVSAALLGVGLGAGDRVDV
jgi:hypothetical protein